MGFWRINNGFNMAGAIRDFWLSPLVSGCAD